MKKKRDSASLPEPDIIDGEADAPSYFAAYSEHSNLLRTWLVAYGIGGPVLIVSQDKVWANLAQSAQLEAISALFLSGVLVQVILAALNKSVMWACYYGALIPSYKSSRRYKTASWLSEKYIIDLFCDVVSMAVFAWATFLCFVSLSNPVVP